MYSKQLKDKESFLKEGVLREINKLKRKTDALNYRV